VRLEGDQARSVIEMVHRTPVYRLRGHSLPWVYLNCEIKPEEAISRTKQELQLESKASTRQVSGSESFHFALARSKHLLWKTWLRLFLDGKSVLNENEAGSHENCALGIWLYSRALREYGGLLEMQQLAKMHIRLHAAAREVIALKKSGDLAQAEQELERIELASQEIVSLLGAVGGRRQAAGLPTLWSYMVTAGSSDWSLMRSMTPRRPSSSRWGSS
jgi:hypothetical protein